MKDLAAALKEVARGLRRYLILDCCFAAAAVGEFQSGSATQVVREKTLDAFPTKGTALLCAASSKDPARAPHGASYTMFTGALLDVLINGQPDLGARLSLEELGSSIIRRLKDTYTEEAVRPEVHAPDQRDGNIADLPLFPTFAHRVQAVAESVGTVQAVAVQSVAARHRGWIGIFHARKMPALYVVMAGLGVGLAAQWVSHRDLGQGGDLGGDVADTAQAQSGPASAHDQESIHATAPVDVPSLSGSSASLAEDPASRAKPLTRPADDLPPGEIEVQLNTRKLQSIEDREVTLVVSRQSIRPGKVDTTLTARTDARGVARFASQAIESDHVYEVKAGVGAARYSSGQFQFRSRTAGMRVVLPVYEGQANLDGLLLLTRTLVSIVPQDNLLVVEVLMRFENLGDTAWVPENQVMALPEGFEALKVRDVMGDARFEGLGTMA